MVGSNDGEDLVHHAVGGLDVNGREFGRANRAAKEAAPSNRDAVAELLEGGTSGAGILDRGEVGEVLDLAGDVDIVTHLDALTELLDVAGQVRLNITHSRDARPGWC